MDHRNSLFPTLPQPWQSIIVHAAPLACLGLSSFNHLSAARFLSAHLSHPRINLFGFLGLTLGVPVCTHIFGQAIRYKKTTQSEGLDKFIEKTKMDS